MADILQRYFPEAINMRESPKEADWYILGGGTLISPYSKFLTTLPETDRIIGISLGVSYNWRGEYLETLKRMKKIYVRDYFSHKILKEYGIKSTLSFDLLCELGGEKPQKRKGTFANFLHKFPDLRWGINEYFAMSPVEDIEAMPGAKVYVSAVELRNRLASAERIFATRLHANIIAWLSGCKRIHTIPYDMKVIHFWERINRIKIEEAQETVKRHLKEIYEEITD